MCILVFPNSFTSYSTLWTGPRRGWGAAGARPRRPQRQWNCDSTFPRFSRCTGTSVNGQNDRRRCGLSIHHRIVPQLVRNAEICQGYSLGALQSPVIRQGSPPRRFRVTGTVRIQCWQRYFDTCYVLELKVMRLDSLTTTSRLPSSCEVLADE